MKEKKENELNEEKVGLNELVNHELTHLFFLLSSSFSFSFFPLPLKEVERKKKRRSNSYPRKRKEMKNELLLNQTNH